MSVTAAKETHYLNHWLVAVGMDILFSTPAHEHQFLVDHEFQSFTTALSMKIVAIDTLRYSNVIFDS